MERPPNSDPRFNNVAVDRMTYAVRDLQASSADVEGAAFITTDGVVLASVFPKIIGSENLIMTALASIISLAESLVPAANRGDINQLYIKVEHGYLFVMPTADDLLLVALCRESASKLPFAPASEGIIPPRPPGSLRGHAKPEYDDEK